MRSELDALVATLMARKSLDEEEILDAGRPAIRAIPAGRSAAPEAAAEPTA